ncbi:hypothetical protein [Caulobacter sp. 17J65-9]|uniref:hypothetical protein n=1 Tax=Caulobacter sp. 17J65-9 TaxID=2709382 RepID=UPI0013C8CBFB|nr:hypothetical protein [Caulobacter sp. 17J65-9]NEX93654.1 hypothetical protein [Caulobacter sp. 17J65-9]
MNSLPVFPILFAVAWLVAMSYVGMLLVVGLRLEKLRASGRLPADTPAFLISSPLLPRLRWVYGDGHRTVDDALVSRLTPLIRVLFPLGVVLVGGVFAAVFRLG